MEIITPQQLWEHYDRHKDSDATIINQNEDGSERKLYYNGYSADGSVVRIYARLVLPAENCAAHSFAKMADICANNQALAGQPTNQAATNQPDNRSDNQQNNNLNDKQSSGANIEDDTQANATQKQNAQEDIRQDAQQDGAKKLPPVIILLRSAFTDINTVETDFFTSRGFAVLLVDYFGNSAGKQYFTIYPKSINAFWQGDAKLISIPPQEPKKSCWYYWTTCILHSVTYLENCGLIDADRIGILGVDEGASLVFKSSFCAKIKAGITFYSGDLVGSGEEYLSYKASLDSRAYSKNKFPILINAATNEQSGTLDYLNDLYSSLLNTCFCIFPVALRATSEQQRANVKIWFDSAFEGISVIEGKPAINTPALDGFAVASLRPALSVFASDGAVYAEVVCQNAKVDFYYAEDCIAATRNWKTGATQRIGENRFLCKLDIGNPDKAVHVFASLTFDSGFTLSTAIVLKYPLKLGAANVTPTQSRLAYQSEDGVKSWLTVGDDIFASPPQILEGPLGISGVSGDVLTTFKLGDIRYKGRIGSLLQLMISANTAQDLEITLIDKDGEGEYKCKKRLVANEWTTITLSSEDFKSTKGLPVIDRIVGIRLNGSGLILNSMLWV